MEDDMGDGIFWPPIPVGTMIYTFVGGPLSGQERVFPATEMTQSQMWWNSRAKKYCFELLGDRPLLTWYKLTDRHETRPANVPGEPDTDVYYYKHIGNTSVSCTEPPDEEYREYKLIAEEREARYAKETEALFDLNERGRAILDDEPEECEETPSLWSKFIYWLTSNEEEN